MTLLISVFPYQSISSEEQEFCLLCSLTDPQSLMSVTKWVLNKYLLNE